MKNASLHTKQNANIKRTLSLEEFFSTYVESTKTEIHEFKEVLIQLKKNLTFKAVR